MCVCAESMCARACTHEVDKENGPQERGGGQRQRQRESVREKQQEEGESAGHIRIHYVHGRERE